MKTLSPMNYYIIIVKIYTQQSYHRIPKVATPLAYGGGYFWVIKYVNILWNIVLCPLLFTTFNVLYFFLMPFRL